MNRLLRSCFYFAFAALGLIVALHRRALAGEEFVGKTYWYKNGEKITVLSYGTEAVDVLGYGQPSDIEMRPYYDVTRGSGDRDKLWAYELEGEIKRGELLPYDPVAREREEKAKAQKQAAATVQARIRLIESKGWPKAIEDAVKKKTVILGMTQEQVELSVGKPGRINRNVGSWGIHEQWVYGSSYLYFENGILKSWQDQR